MERALARASLKNDLMAAGETMRVLLVDDEEALAWSLSTRLAKARPRLSIETANDGEVALAKLRAQPVDLLVADVRMPGMTGTDLILEARRTQPLLPAIIMTAFRTAEVQSLARTSGTSFLEKPFDFERFVALVEDHLSRAPQVGFSGAIAVQTLPDIVQLYVLSAQTGALRIHHHSADGDLYFQQGAITHATTSSGLTGEVAFFEIMTWSGGQFSTRVGVTAPVRSITTNWTELIMESCRLADERKREADGRPSRSGWTLAPPAADVDLDIDIDLGELAPRSEPDRPITRAPHDPPSGSSHSEEHMNIKESLSKLNQIDGFVGAALVDAESGMLLGQEGGGSMNLEVAAAGNTEVVKSKRKTMSNLGLKETIEDILITLGKQYHLIRPLRSRPTLFFYVALDRARANLAMARIALADVEKDLTI